MIILAVETAGPRGGVAVVVSGELKSEVSFETHGRLGAALMPGIKEAFKQAGLPIKARPDLVIVDIGPGSYTGIRVALAATKGMAFGWKCPLVGVKSSTALVSKVEAKNSRVAVVTDAGKGEIYAEVFEATKFKQRNGTSWISIWSPKMTRPVELLKACGTKEALILVGDAAEMVRMACPKAAPVSVLEGADWPQARDIATVGLEFFRNGRISDILSLTPVYMRPTAPEANRVRKRKRSTSRV